MSQQLTRAACLYASCYCEENAYKLCTRLPEAGACKSLDGLLVVFVSNPSKKVPLWCQKSGAGDPLIQGLVVWDYHVMIVQHRRPEGSDALESLVWDLDSTLPFPCSGPEYAARALRCEFANRVLPEQLNRFYRVMPAAAFLDNFASDRSHMLSDYPESPDHYSMHGEMKKEYMRIMHPHYQVHAEGGNGVCLHASRSEGDETDKDKDPAAEYGAGSLYASPPPPWPAIRGRKSQVSMNLPRYCDMCTDRVQDLPLLLRMLRLDDGRRCPESNGGGNGAAAAAVGAAAASEPGRAFCLEGGGHAARFGVEDQAGVAAVRDAVAGPATDAGLPVSSSSTGVLGASDEERWQFGLVLTESDFVSYVLSPRSTCA